MGSTTSSASVVEEGLSIDVLGAAGKGEAQAVAAWLDGGGGVDAHCAEPRLMGMTLLMSAASCGGHGAMVRMLLQRGASINLQNSIGDTALMCAATNGHTTIVRVLLDAKSDASLQDTRGRTALMWAERTLKRKKKIVVCALWWCWHN